MSAEALANASPKSYFTSVNTGIYVVMGVSGSGKSLIGSRLARAIGIEFVEGDDFHPAENIERMSSGIPLTDFHRAGWLGAIGRRLRVAADAGAGVVVSCSALKRSYRDMLRADTNNVQFKGRKTLSRIELHAAMASTSCHRRSSTLNSRHWRSRHRMRVSGYAISGSHLKRSLLTS